MLKQSPQQSNRRKHFKALGQIISQSQDRDHLTGRAITGEWRGQPSQLKNWNHVDHGPKRRVMQLDRGTVKP